MRSGKVLFHIIALATALSMPLSGASAGTAPLSLEGAIRQALEWSPEAQEVEAAHQRSQLQSKLSLSPFLPHLAAEVGTLQQSPSDQNNSGSYIFGVGRINLYNGGFDSLSRRAQKLEADRTERSLALVQQRISRDVIRRYSELLFIDESLRLKKDALEINREQLQMARRKASGGITSNADSLEFEFRENALNTEISLLGHERTVTARELNVVIGLEPQTEIVVEGALTSELANYAINLEGTPNYLEQQTLLTPQTDTEVAELQYQAAKSVWLPKADLEARYGNMELADPSVFGKPAWRVEFRITIPLFSGLETLYARQTTAAALRERESRLRKAQLASQNTLADRSEKIVVLTNLLQLQKENISRADRYYKATLLEYRRGIKNSPDLSGATERLFEARIREKTLIKDLIMARIGLLEATTIDIP